MVSVIAQYENGGYATTVYGDGTKVRVELDENKPPVLPEQMDLKITDWCDAGCAWCHEQSTTKGKHGDLKKAAELLKQMPRGAEIAIGGGDPLSHPDFAWFVREIRSYGLIPSVTVNGVHFEKHLPVIKELTAEGSLFGVGFSYAGTLPDWDYENLVVHLIVGVHSPFVLKQAKKRFKVLLLGYKQHGRGLKLFRVRSSEVNDCISVWFRALPLVAKNHHLSFDNLAIEQLNPQRIFFSKETFDSQYMGQEGDFSMYLDAVEQTYGLSSYEAERFSWTNMKDMFSTIRSSQGLAVGV